MSGAARVLVAVVRLYQRVLSPLLPPSCRYLPSCSAYAVEAVQVHGALRGGWLAVRRLLRCQPFCAGGLDPVPPGRHAAPAGSRQDGRGAAAHPAPPTGAGAPEPGPSSWSAPCSM